MLLTQYPDQASGDHLICMLKAEPPSRWAPRGTNDGIIPSDSASVPGRPSTAEWVVVLCPLLEGKTQLLFSRDLYVEEKQTYEDSCLRAWFRAAVGDAWPGG